MSEESTSLQVTKEEIEQQISLEQEINNGLKLPEVVERLMLQKENPDLVAAPVENTAEQMDATLDKAVAEQKIGAEDLAAQMFTMFGPRFMMHVDQLQSLKAAKRVLKKLVTFPLNEKAFNPTSELEKEIFNLGDRLLQSKYLMIIHTFNESEEMKKAMEKKVETELKPESTTDDKSSV